MLQRYVLVFVLVHAKNDFVCLFLLTTSNTHVQDKGKKVNQSTYIAPCMVQPP